MAPRFVPTGPSIVFFWGGEGYDRVTGPGYNTLRIKTDISCEQSKSKNNYTGQKAGLARARAFSGGAPRGMALVQSHIKRMPGR